jgi:hypothetical protein
MSAFGGKADIQLILYIFVGNCLVPKRDDFEDARQKSSIGNSQKVIRGRLLLIA